MVRRFVLKSLLALTALLALAACGSPTPAVPAAEAPTQTPAASTLASSVLLARWDFSKPIGEIVPMDLVTGEPLAGHEPISLGHHFSHAFSADGRVLAAVAWPGTSSLDGRLHRVDLTVWEDRVLPIEFDGPVDAMAFSPDGARLALTGLRSSRGMDDPPGSHVVVVDLDSGAVAAESRLAFQATQLAFSPQGDSLLVYGQSVVGPLTPDPVAQAALLLADDLAVVWQRSLPEIVNVTHRQMDGEPRYFWYQPAVVLSPEGLAAYIVHADAEQLTTVDFARREVRTANLLPARSWLEWLLARTAGVAQAKMTDGTIKQAVLSPDGSRLYVAGQTMASVKTEGGQWEYTRRALDLQVIETATGAIVGTLPTDASEISLSADGSRLFLRGWRDPDRDHPNGSRWTQVVDTAEIETVAMLLGYALMPARRLDGSPILLSNHVAANGQQAAAIFSPESLEPIREWDEWGSSTYWLVGP